MVLFNPVKICEQMRQDLADGNWHELKYWAGGTIILSICTILCALVASFTAWGMVSAISDDNVHCVLRSSIGQYICQLPHRLVLSSLYLFLLWILIFMFELLAGPFRFLMIVFVLVVFFQVIIAFSAFGRLIIHTGAMGKRQILDPEFERALLPSGLHASLLLMAVDNKRERTSAISQYKGPQRKSSQRKSGSSRPGSSKRSERKRKQRKPSIKISRNEFGASESHQVRLHPVDECRADKPMTSIKTVKRMSTDDVSEMRSSGYSSTDTMSDARSRSSGQSDKHMRVLEESDELKGGSAHSALARKYEYLSNNNSSEESEKAYLQKPAMVETPKFVNHPSGFMTDEDLMRIQNAARSLSGPSTKSAASSLIDDDSEESSDVPAPMPPRLSRDRSVGFALQQTKLLGHKSTSKFIHDEWEAEKKARSVYEIEPPVEIMESEDDDDIVSDDENDTARRVQMPRASVLNKVEGLATLQKIAQGRKSAWAPAPKKQAKTTKFRNFVVPMKTFFRAFSEDSAKDLSQPLPIPDDSEKESSQPLKAPARSREDLADTGRRQVAVSGAGEKTRLLSYKRLSSGSASEDDIIEYMTGLRENV